MDIEASSPISLCDVQNYVRKRRRTISVLRRLLDRLGWSPALGCRLIEEVLRSRARFPAESWASKGMDGDTIRPYLTTLSRVILLPNDHFLPEDNLLAILLATDNGDFLGEQVLAAYRRLSGNSDRTKDILQEALDKHWNLGQCILALLKTEAD